MKNVSKLTPLEGAHGVYTDALLTDSDRLLFGSFWGRDTSVQEFIARLQIGAGNGGLESFKIDGNPVYPGNIDHLEKRTGRHVSPVFGNMIHLWIYNAELTKDNQGANSAYIVDKSNGADYAGTDSLLHHYEEAIWGKMLALSPVPLMDRWACILVPYGIDKGWVTLMEGCDICAVKIQLPDDFEYIISELVQGNELYVYDDYEHSEPLTTVNPDTEVSPLVIGEFVSDFSQNLLGAVAVQSPPVHRLDEVNPAWDAVMDNLLRTPFEKQRDRVHAAAKLLVDQQERAVVINGEMGTGKTMMGICTAEILASEGIKRHLVICPPQLVYKWRREIQETVPDARVWVLNGPDTLVKLLKLREIIGSSDVPEYFIIGRVRMRMGFTWKPVYMTRIVARMDDDGDVKDRMRVCACPRCGEKVKNEDGEFVTPVFFPTSQQTSCKSCDERLWSLVRPDQKSFDRDKALRKSLCKLPTIGPKTADKLVAGFGSESLASMMEDNVYEFINLIDDNGDLVFSDRQAARFERRMAKMEFSFGQGGYQPTEFIKRYLPAGYFGTLQIDEGHEYKNQSAQGQAMGVLSMCCQKVILLTGTLMGGYADDLFHLLWRVMPGKMIEDGFRYNDRGSIGPASMAFMREHGVLKDVYKESQGENHKTARGKKMTVRTSKAPGFGPMGIMRFVLPYTVFLRLSDLEDSALPDYQEEYIDVPMMDEQREHYDTLSGSLTYELKQALRKGDRTLLGVVLNALLAWPDCCFRPETVKHPRTRDVLAFVPTVFSEGDISPKEQKLIDLCKAEIAAGRRVLAYSVYTGTRDTMSRLQSILNQAGMKTAVLRSSVKTDEREDWILDKVDQGIDILITNPELVKTGLDLLEFPTIVFMQSGYNVYTLQQAARRSWRIGQTEDVKVIYLGYENSAQTDCLALMAKKIQVSQSTSGCMPESGLDILNQEAESLEVILARKLVK